MLAVYMPSAGVEVHAAVLVAIGFGVGVLAAFFGMGGGWIVTPTLNILGFPVAHAIGTELANITCQSGVAVVKHRKMGNIEFRLGLCVGLFMAVGVELGKRVIACLTRLGLADRAVRWAYIVFLTGLGGYMLYENLRTRRRAADPSGLGRDAGADRAGILTRLRLPPMITLRTCGVSVSIWILAALGIAIGFLAGLIGCGGGFALVPAFVYLMGIPTVVAVGTSLLCVMISGGYGAFTYGMDGFVEFYAVAWLVAGSLVGTQFGAASVRYVRGRGIRLLYSLMLLLAATGVLMKQLSLKTPALVVTLGGALAMCFVIIGWMVVARAAVRRESAPEDD